jgi:uncharacterized alpha-E superfamily protein
MLGRTANDLFWMARYVERAENMARLIEVGYRIALLPRDGEGYHEEWRSTLASAGCAQGYFAKHEALNTSDVINYLLFDCSNSSSVKSCLTAARRNGRAQRTALTRDMWEALNGAWLEFSNINPAGVTADALPRILDWIRSRSALYRGALLNTILRNDTYYFSQMGTFLERADNTARILDVKYYVLLPEIDMVGSGIDNVQWGAILRSVSAHRSYRWVYKEHYRPWRIAEYLILNQAMPRSLRSCYNYLKDSLDQLAELYGDRFSCHDTAWATTRILAEGDIGKIFQSGLHEFLEDFIARNNRLGSEIAEAYHFNA